jgi:hypothetical protein
LESREGDNLAVKVNGAVTIRATFLNAFLAYVSSNPLFLTKERLNNAALENVWPSKAIVVSLAASQCVYRAGVVHHVRDATISPLDAIHAGPFDIGDFARPEPDRDAFQQAQGRSAQGCRADNSAPAPPDRSLRRDPHRPRSFQCSPKMKRGGLRPTWRSCRNWCARLKRLAAVTPLSLLSGNWEGESRADIANYSGECGRA